MLTDDKRSRWLGMDMRPRWRRRLAVVVTYAGFLAAISLSGERWWGHPLLAMWVLNFLVLGIGVFRGLGPLKRFDDGLEERPAARMIVNGLDEWARYRYGAESFEEATAEQQAELLRRYRVGSFLVPAKMSRYRSLDEREMRERDGAVRWSIRWVAVFLSGLIAHYGGTRRPISGMDVVADLMVIAVMVWTLPQARVLWTERDPREMGGEMELVGKEA